ncbi:MAG: hypothetical protein J6S67_08175 [Methanobrevibacter sp.]|nr:hypothetical protein [Methanobrevibacter sp.]
MQERKLQGHRYMQAKVLTNDDGLSEVLVSYNTAVVFQNFNSKYEGRRTFKCSGLYSATTIKHISLYMREYGLSYYLIKPIAGTEWTLVLPNDTDPWSIRYYNEYTGEIIQWDRIPDNWLNRKSTRKYFVENDI